MGFYRRSRIRKVLTLTGIMVIVGILVCRLSLPDFSSSASDLLEPVDLSPSNTSLPSAIRILYWTTVFGASRPSSKLTIRHPNGVVACHVTAARRHLETSHLVLFHFHQESWAPLESNGGVELPRAHPPWQKWVYYSQEPQTFHRETRGDIAVLFENSINVIATHMHSSDLPLPYGGFRARSIPLSRAALNRLQSGVSAAAGKTKLAAILVSNCGRDDTHGVDNGRFSFVEQLQQLVPLDVYGGCGIQLEECASKCGHDGQHRCLSKLGSMYKFYLSLENSDCDDYITEKYWKNALRYNMLPIVRGKRNNYDHLAIPASYIHADRFPSVQALADYLLLLDRNETLYNSYFQWKQHYSLVDTRLTSDCSQELSELDSTLCHWAVDHWADAPKRHTLSEYIDPSKHCSLPSSTQGLHGLG